MTRKKKTGKGGIPGAVRTVLISKKYEYSVNIENKKRFQSLETSVDTSDLARIQTWNLLSRNQVRYSVAPQGH